jgi:BlaR1 peptidase M56
MPTLLLYVIKLSCSLGLMWLFYRLVLRNLTFYNANRWYLLGYSLLCFLIPLIDIGPIYKEDPLLEPLIVQYIPVIGQAVAGDHPAIAAAPSWDAWTGVLIVLGVGAFLLLVRFAVRCLSLRRIRRRAVLLESGPVAIYQVDERIVPFSWGNAVYINQHLHTEAEWAEIILHEYVHIRQRHYLDILVSEALTILNWYNPFAWLIRYSIRQNLEFIADRAVVEKGVDKKGYQYHLLKVVGQSSYRLANNFNFSSLKKRIIMMNKMRSARLHLLRFLFILPLLAVLLVAFRGKYDGLLHRSTGPVYANVAGIVFDITSRKVLAGAVVRETGSGVEAVTDDRGYYKFAVPVKGDSFRIELAITKAGYKDGKEGAWGASPNGSFGIVRASGLWDGMDRPGMVFAGVPYVKKAADDPGYPDALIAYKYELKWNDDYAHFTDIQKAHPEVSLFYTTEGKQRHVVVRVDGGVERYGYPGGPAVTDMEKKYGVLPDLMKGGEGVAPSGYRDHWAAISAEAEKEFHSAVPVRAIVFPGDSRVIVVPLTGKPRFYDMDSDQPEERPAFERGYGKLPDCVPPPYHYKPTGEARLPAGVVEAQVLAKVGEARVAAKVVDTVPGKDTARSAHGKDAGRPAPEKIEALKKFDPKNVLWIVDGKEQAEFNMDSVHPQDIAAIDVFKGEQAVELFGSKGDKGVVAVITKKYQNAYQANKHGEGVPLYVVNGREAPANILQVLMVARIASVDVLTDSAARARYGDKGKNGVICITLKKE